MSADLKETVIRIISWNYWRYMLGQVPLRSSQHENTAASGKRADSK